MRVRTQIMNRYLSYIQGSVWKKLRSRIIKQRGSCCERCGKTKNLQVHHKTYKRLFNEKDSDLEVLCRGCHMKEHGILTDKFYPIPEDVEMQLDVYHNRNGCCDLCGQRKSFSGFMYIFYENTAIMGCKKHFQRRIRRLMHYGKVDVVSELKNIKENKPAENI